MTSPIRPLIEGYDFIRRECERRGTDCFELGVGPLTVTCMRGPEAGTVFYSDRFERAGAMPRRVRRTLLGEGGVQGLDGEDHHHRKALFLSLMTPDALDDLTTITDAEWDAAIARWQARHEPIRLLTDAAQVLSRAVHRWSGVPLAEDDVAQRTDMLHALIDTPARVGPRHWRGRRARSRADRWAADLIDDVRAGKLEPPAGRALHAIATHRTRDGQLLEPSVAAVELINILRPTIAIDRFIVFAALALVEHPQWYERLRTSDDAIEPFTQEVRRHYPFFPAAAAKVRTPFDWGGLHFPAGRLTLFDLYGTNHHPDVWADPDRFDPERFVDRDIGPLDLVPQGGGGHESGHRCAGEWLTIAPDQPRPPRPDASHRLHGSRSRPSCQPSTPPDPTGKRANPHRHHDPNLGRRMIPVAQTSSPLGHAPENWVVPEGRSAEPCPRSASPKMITRSIGSCPRVRSALASFPLGAELLILDLAEFCARQRVLTSSMNVRPSRRPRRSMIALDRELTAIV